MKIVIVFHSVCGNTYLMAKVYEEALKAQGVDVELYRVHDADWAEKPDASPQAQVNLRAMMALPEAKPDVLINADLIILGSPTYFGNVTGEMKMFMDATGGLWFHGKLIGKKCAIFSSAGNTEGGGDLCLQALSIYAQYMGMASIPVPVTLVPGEVWPAFGIIHYSMGKYGEILPEKTIRAIKNYCAYLIKVLQT